MSAPQADVAAFVSEHGRPFRPQTHKAFDPFRRPQIPVPYHIQLTLSILSIAIIPLRFILAFICILPCYVMAVIFGPPVTEQSRQYFEPTLLPPWRRRIITLACQVVGRVLLFCLGFWTVEGEDHPDYDHAAAQKATIVSNHSSLADPCLLAYLYAPSFVAKSAVWKIPGIGRIGAAQHAFYFNRLTASSISVTDCIVKRQHLVAKSDIPIPPVAIFPEGTTTNGNHLLKFRTGAFVAGMPIAPVLIKYSSDYFSLTYETVRTGKYIYGLLSQLRNHVWYYRLPLYYPTEEEKKNPSLYARNVHRLMLEQSRLVFGHSLTLSDSNYIDKMEYHSIVRGTPLKKGLQLNMPE